MAGMEGEELLGSLDTLGGGWWEFQVRFLQVVLQ
jgi:hypothetical protein